MTKSYGHLEAVVWVSETGDIGDASPKLDFGDKYFGLPNSVIYAPNKT